ncbi:MAG: sugar-binding protein, partial [Planctomycetota bacterium]
MLRPGRFLRGLLPLLLLTTPVFAQEAEPVPARVVHDFVPDGVLDEWAGAVSLELGEGNLIRNEASGLSMSWGGPRDLSGTFYVGYTATDLVIAGEVRDDDLVPNPRIWWLGDEVEVFLDIRLDESEPTPEVYDRDDYQLILFPFVRQGRRWGFAVARGERALGDGGFDGVHVESKPLRDEEDRDIGYAFEAAIPLVNLTGFSVQKGLTIGFDVALVDVDGAETRQKTYMTLSGRADLASNPSRFGRLVFEEPLPTAPAPPDPTGLSLLGPGLILLGAAVVVIALWRFRRGLVPATELRVRTKLVVICALLGLLVVSQVTPRAFRSARRAQRRAALEEKVARLRDILSEARGEGLLGTLEVAPDPEGITALLGGGLARPPQKYVYREVWAREPPGSVTKEGVPVLSYQKSLTAGESARFVAPAPTLSRAAVVLCSFTPDPASRRPLEEGFEVGAVRIHREGGEAVERPLRYGIDIDAEAPRDLTIALPATSVVLFVEVLQNLEEGTLVAEAATLVPPDPNAPVPLPLITRTLVGVPTNLHRDRPRESSVTLGPGSDPVRIPLVPPA